MKKVLLIMLTVIMCSYMLPSAYAKEQTLDQLYAEAKANRDAYNKQKKEKELTEAEKAKTIQAQKQAEIDIKNITVELKNIEEEVKQLQEDIKVKEAEVKKIMSYVQLSNGESAYLEYAFGASSFTDFIYRVSVAEQLSDYNDKLIKEYNDDIKTLEQKQKDLAAKQVELEKKKKELAELEKKLTGQIEELKHGMLDKDREYGTTMDLINSMKSLGCRGSDTMSQCMNRNMGASSDSFTLHAAKVPSTNGTYMPIARGRVTSDYGYRSDGLHAGIDFSNSKYGDNVYPVALGQVILVQSPGTYTSNGRNCGNWIVYVKHNIKGHPYITSYWHLASPSVSKGQSVTPNTVIGKMGGYHSVDECAFGVHVHLNLFDGNTWSGKSPNKGRINPRTIMPQIPAKGVLFER